jgi:hypothetical protein
MSSNNRSDGTCIGVAVDHRIRRLFSAVPQVNPSTRHGTHLPALRDYGKEAGRPTDELAVTEEIAGPATMGGIVIVLQQPRENHPFRQGTVAVMNDCPTFVALDHVFDAASRGTINIRRDVSMIDLLPYTSAAAMQEMDIKALKKAFQTSVQAVCGKRPKVVLCAGKVRTEFDKGEAKKLESIGVGKVHRYPITMVRGDDWDTEILSVNGFHPSHAVNYRPELSCLRQLLLLVAAETCGTYRGDWSDETWMNSLRDTCSKASRQSNGRGNRDFSYYKEKYTIALNGIGKGLDRLSKPTAIDAEDLYDDLLATGLTEKCNDASLILAQLWKMKPERYVSWIWVQTQQAAKSTLALINKWPSCPPYFGPRALDREIRRGISDLGNCITATARDNLNFDLQWASSVFLDMAVALETILENELRAKDDEFSTIATGSDTAGSESLFSQFERLKI